MKRLLLLLSALSLLLCLAACTSQPPADDSETPATQETKPEEADAPKVDIPEEPVLTLGENGQGTYVAPVSLGEKYIILATVSFTYATEEDGSPYITDFGEVTVENAAGWFNVEKKAEFQQEELSLSEDGKTAIIPFTYYASIGSGANPETGVVDIDLNKLSKPK